jgi:hypothetical protein
MLGYILLELWTVKFDFIEQAVQPVHMVSHDDNGF